MGKNPENSWLQQFLTETKFRFEMSQYLQSTFPTKLYFSTFERVSHYLILCLPLPTYLILKPLVKSRWLRAGLSAYVTGSLYLYNGLVYDRKIFFGFMEENKEHNLLAEYMRENWDEFKTAPDAGPQETPRPDSKNEQTAAPAERSKV